MKTISVLGCGKLGFPLALDLLNEGYDVKGSTTTVSKIDRLKQSGISSYFIIIEDFIESDFFNSDILVLTLPFKKSFSDPNGYKNQIKIVCDYVSNSSIKHIIFTSSSSVYPKDKQFYLPTDKFEPGSVCEILQSGYTIYERLLRPAMVGVSKKIESNKTED